ncbi:Kinesin light chain 3 [Hondaea fermentalgiana]|uniref:Kinesin light chain 3 n=1 Tax=Hondaea fermentalgiana TaxID=2315210 RepID=A0A2R5GGD1_9STRA|nr:Kinesin light chain 3 [Hondaea fermentalgiana]|eukprot:GBG29930.1 Kinesin light chain 3 [Hondaea fermentalgiana]
MALRGESGAKAALGRDDGKSEARDFCGLSVAALQRLAQGVVDGSLAPDIELYVLNEAVMSSGNTIINAGRTVAVRQDDAPASKKSNPSAVNFSTSQASLKPRHQWTIRDVHEHVLRADIRRHLGARSYLDVVRREHARLLGNPFEGAYVIQAHHSIFGHLVAAIAAHFEHQNAEQSFVWLDVFAADDCGFADQSATLAEKRADFLAQGLFASIEQFDSCLFYVDHWTAPTIITRMRCIWELYGAIKSCKNIEAISIPGEDEQFVRSLPDTNIYETCQYLSRLDIESASCSAEQDRIAIIAAAQRVPGGITTINLAVMNGLRSCLVKRTTRGLAKVLAKEGTSLLVEDRAMEKILGSTKRVHLQYHLTEDLQVSNLTFAANDYLVRVAKLFSYHKQYSEALGLLEIALSIATTCKGPHDSSVADVKTSMAYICIAESRYETALEHLRSALHIKRTYFFKDVDSIVETHSAIADALHAQGETDDALAQLRESIAFETKHSYWWNKRVPTRTTFQVARILRSESRHDEALAQLQRVLELEIASFGSTSGCVGYIQNAMALELACKGDHKGALTKTLECVTDITKDRKTKTAAEEAAPYNSLRSMCNIAVNMIDLGHVDVGLAQLRKVQQELQDREGPTSPAVLHITGLIAQHLGAVEHFNEALQLLEEAHRKYQTSLATSREYPLEHIEDEIVRVLRRQGKFDAALTRLRCTLQRTRAALGTEHVECIMAYEATASILQAQGCFDEALAHYQEALKMRQARFGEESPELLGTMRAIAFVFGDQGRFDQALAQLCLAKQLQTKQTKEGNSRCAGTMLDVASVLNSQGKSSAALEQLLGALEMLRTQETASSDGVVLSILESISNTLESQGDLQGTLAHLKELHALEREMFGEDNINLVRTMKRIALVLAEQGMFVEADSQLEKVRNLTETALGPASPQLWELAEDHAAILTLQGKLGEALTLLRGTKEKRKTHYGSRHLSVARVTEAIALILCDQGWFDEALAQLQEALSIRKEELSPSHTMVRETERMIAHVHEESGKSEAALEMQKNILGSQQSLLGSNHPFLLDDVKEVSLTMMKLGRFEESLTSLQEFLEALISDHGLNHPWVANISRTIAAVFHGQGELDKSLEYYRQEHHILKNLDPAHPLIASNMRRTAMVLQEKGEDNGALAQLDEIAKMQNERRTAVSFLEATETLDAAASVFRSQGRYEEALSRCREALQVRQKCLTPTHLDVLYTQIAISRLHSDLCQYEPALAQLQEVCSIFRMNYAPLCANCAMIDICSIMLMQGRAEDALMKS